jgi:tetratricopeptide (TPR) repeat protein
MIIKSLCFILFVNLFSDGEYKDYLKKGDEYHHKFNNLQAALAYEQAYKLAEDNYEVLMKLSFAYNDAGEEYYELRRMEDAEAYINKALFYSKIFYEKFPDSAEVYTSLAMSYGNLAIYRGGKEKIKLARKVEVNARKAIKLKPEQYTSYVILGIYNREVGNLNFAERLFANTFFGGVPEGSFEESVKMLEKALLYEPNTIVAAYQLSKTYRLMGNEKKERELLEQLIKYKIRNFRDKFALEKTNRRLAVLAEN